MPFYENLDRKVKKGEISQEEYVKKVRNQEFIVEIKSQSVFEKLENRSFQFSSTPEFDEKHKQAIRDFWTSLQKSSEKY
jgi:hypothetical protein